MAFHSLILTLMFSLLVSGQIVLAEEDLVDEADAAAAQTDAIKERISEERQEAKRNLERAKDRHQSAMSRRQDALSRLRSSEAEIENAQQEKVRLNKEAERLDNETLLTEKAVQQNRALAEKLKGEVQALKDLRGEKAKNFIELTTQRDRAQEDAKALETAKAQAEEELKKVKEQEKLAMEQLERLKVEHAQNKVRTEAYIAGLRERYKEAQEKTADAQTEQASVEQETLQLAEQAKVAEKEVHAAEGASINRTITNITGTPTEEVVFRRKCRVFDGPTKGAKVLGVKTSGTSVPKSEEGKTWFAIQLEDGRKGFASKNCFR